MGDDSDRQVFIKNIPYDVDDATLSDWCLSFGPIDSCFLKRDKDGYSRGFAFVTFATVDGHNNILSNEPHYCQGRRLIVRTAYSQANSNEYSSNSSSEQLTRTTPFLSTNETFNNTTIDDNSIVDDDNHSRLASVHDELEANLECMQIAHEHEINLLREKLARETKLRKEAEESHKEAEEDWRKENAENIRLRTSLIKNVMQTFNIRKNLARQTKDQSRKCAQIEKQCEDIQSNRMSSRNTEKLNEST